MKNPFRRAARDADFDRETLFHVEQLVEANLARGMTSEEARRQALVEFGGREQIKEELRDVHRIPLLEAIAANLRYALRTMHKAPAFSATVILTLALGIGANTAVFSAVDAVVLRPLPFPESDRLVRVEQRDKQSGNLPPFIAPVRLEDWNRMNSTFQGITGWYSEDVSETSGPLPEKVTRAGVAARFLQVLGVSPLLGRDFTPEEQRFGGPNAILISYRLWQERFAGDPHALGRTLRFGTSSSTIVGVMPASFSFPNKQVDVWMPVPVNGPYAQNREMTWYRAAGRLRRGVTLAQARADLSLVQERLGKEYPKTDARIAISLQALKESTIGESGTSLWLLFGAVTLLLLIACINVAALWLARATDREQEISVRFALGGSRATIMAQLMTEALVLAVAGAMAGLAVAWAAEGTFRRLASDLPRVSEIAINWRIGAYALGCAVAATLICGLFPSLRATRGTVNESLGRKSRGQVSGRNPLQWTLVGAQVALAMTLLVAAGLLLRSFKELGKVAAGFDPSHVLTLRISGSYAETADMKALTQHVDGILDRLHALPGVQATATASALPGVPGEYPTELKSTDGGSDANEKIMADSRFVSPGYFATTSIPLLEGQNCREHANGFDLVVNQIFANKYFGEGPAIGHNLQVVASEGSFRIAGRIVGIAGDAREQGLNRAPMPTVYWCMSAPTPSPNYLIRTSGDPGLIAESVRAAVHEVEPNRSVFDIAPLEEQLSDAFAENLLRTVLLGAFALTAVSLACVGLYGTLTYLVSLRRREVGLRLALGAARKAVVLQFLLQGLCVCAFGCACGMVLAIASGRVLKGMLFGVSPVDAPTLIAVTVLLLVVAGAAAFVPSLRASRTDPMNVLREG